MGIKVYGGLSSPFVATVVLTLYEKDQEFELERCDSKSPDYLAKINPFGKIPSYQDEDITLFESRAIARYIATKFEGQGTPLLGSSLKEQALVNQWMEVESQNFIPPLMGMGMEMRKAPADQDIAVITTNKEKLVKVLDIYEARLSKSKYLAGDFYSLADLLHTSMLSILLSMMHNMDPEQKKMITSRPHLTAWYEDISSRPAWKKVLARPDAAPYAKPSQT